MFKSAESGFLELYRITFGSEYTSSPRAEVDFMFNCFK